MPSERLPLALVLMSFHAAILSQESDYAVRFCRFRDFKLTHDRDFA
jgi:hypothetical protein